MRLLPLVALIAGWCALADESHREAATRLYRERKFDAAAAELETHLAQRPEDLSMRLLLGLCRQLSGDRQAASAVYREAVRLHPKRPEPWFYLARSEFLSGKFDEAVAHARRAEEFGETPDRVYNLIGLVWAEQNDTAKAMAAFDKAIAYDPRRAGEALLNSGVLLLKNGNARAAVDRLARAVTAQPNSAEARFHRARALLELDRRKEAEADLIAATRIGNHEGARRLLDQLRAGGVEARLPAGARDAPVQVRFDNVAAEAGLDFVLQHSPTAEKHLLATMPGGVAAFDFDNDGLTDIFFANGAALPSLRKESAAFHNRLFRNEGGWKFRDVTASSGLAGRGYSLGAAAADYDNDGFVDLFVAGYRQNLLYRNTGAGKFEEVTAKAGIAGAHWSVAAAWLDYDNDGFLDLFIVNYLDWSPANNPYCGDRSLDLRVYCHPSRFDPLPNSLYRNRGNGVFEDVSQAAGIAAHRGKGMSAAVADYDNDGLIDIFVTNDTMPNFLFRNLGNGRFEEAALAAGVALNDDGKPLSGMGADFRDYDNDGRPDIFLTALPGETFPLFRNQGKGFFRDVTYPSGLGVASARRGGWSAGLFDFNNDGWKDLFTANSHVTDNIELFSNSKYRLANSLFLNAAGRFADVSSQAGDDFQKPAAHRGAAFADFDNDGHLDAVVTALGEPAELWRNVTGSKHHWIRVKLRGRASNRDGIGAVVRIGGQSNSMSSAVGYASSSHDGVHFGLGDSPQPPDVIVRWPGGKNQTVEAVAIDRVIAIEEPTSPGR